MIKILDTLQQKAVDLCTMQTESISSIELMELAAKGCCSFFPKPIRKQNLVVFCGVGNNGGDGLAIARMQQNNFSSLKVKIIQTSEIYSENFKVNLERWKAVGGMVEIIKNKSEINLSENDIVVDAIFGTGLTRKVGTLISECIKEINRQAKYIISIDLPSGLFASKLSEGEIIKADLTLTIGSPKIALLVPENSQYVGEWKLVSIYTNQICFEGLNIVHNLFDLSSAKRILKNRSKFTHKGSFGKALLVVGSETKYGAAILASRAAMRSGVGLLRVHLPVNGKQLIHLSIPEAIVETDSNNEFITSIGDLEIYDAIGVGPGIGTANETIDGFIALIKEYPLPTVIDADGLNILSEHPDLFTNLSENSILTPHLKEFERLFGSSENSFERLEKQIKHSVLHKIIIVCKGHYTIITLPDGRVFFNNSGNSGLAKAGSGDVLTGIITSLLAQGYLPEEAALLGVFVHGYSADLLLATKHEMGMLPSDVIENLPEAFKKISGQN